MSSIILSKSAADKLVSDPKIQLWQEDRSVRKRPFLGYYRRSYSTSHEGAVTEHGDGFMLTTIDPLDADDTRGIVIKPVAVVNDLDILVGGEDSIMSGSFTIGFSKKFTYEPRTSPAVNDDLG